MATGKFYIYTKPTEKELSQRKQETYDRYCKIIQWGRGHPVEFGNRFCGFDYYDYQAEKIYRTWFSQFALWLVCRDGAKTFDLARYTMLRSLLFPFHVSYFIGNTGEQSKEVFKKIEKIAKKEIASARGLTDVFINELVKNGATSDGFTHSPASFNMRLFNGAEINTLNSDVINIKGKRANLVGFDEAAWMSDELFTQAEHFTDQDEKAVLGGNIDITLEPTAFPNQLLYSSSASDQSSEFYTKMKNFARRMYMGDKRYYACNFNIDLIMNAKRFGEPYPALISQAKVDQAMMNREKGLRELYNKFSIDAHEGQILTRRELMKYTTHKPPELRFTHDEREFSYIFAWDSARLNDNSTIGIAKVWNDEKTGWNMEIVNCVNLVDIDMKNKTPMIMPEQVEAFKKLLLEYNGNEHGFLDYENISAVVCDSGAGGQMVGGVSDYLLSDWTDGSGNTHKGIIDTSHKANETAKYKFPDAVDIMRLIDPQSHRNEIFDAAEKMTKLGVVHFPEEYDGKDFISTIDDDGNENIYQLSADEQISLAQISRMKDEILLMCKYVTSGKVSYNYPTDKRNKVHDDRAFVYGLLCYQLSLLRRGQLRENPVSDDRNVEDIILVRKPKIR